MRCLEYFISMRSGSLYVFFQALLMGSVLLVPAIDPFRWRPAWASQILGSLFLVIGFGLIIPSFKALGRATTPNPEPKAGAGLVTSGVYRYVRHPMYTALLTGMLGWAISMRSPFALLAFANFAIFIHSKANLEESLLEEKFGDSYRQYRQQTGKFLPRPNPPSSGR